MSCITLQFESFDMIYVHFIFDFGVFYFSFVSLISHINVVCYVVSFALLSAQQTVIDY